MIDCLAFLADKFRILWSESIVRRFLAINNSEPVESRLIVCDELVVFHWNYAVWTELSSASPSDLPHRQTYFNGNCCDLLPLPNHP
jgi:hypothetical protein